SSPFFNQALGSVKPLLGDRGVLLMPGEPGFTRPSTGGLPRDYRDPALFLYTSGTTGRPKGVILTHDNLLANVESCQRAGDFDNRDAFLCLLPFFHTYAITGTFLLPLTNGRKMVLVERFQLTKVVGLNQEHKISVRGRNVMRGYHHLPEETAKTITDGWLHTEDLGTIDHDGFVSITGRKKDLIISAGENIYPREIEEILAQHPKVKEVAVIGV